MKTPSLDMIARGILKRSVGSFDENTCNLNEIISLVASKQDQLERKKLDKAESGRLVRIRYSERGPTKELDEVQLKQGSSLIKMPVYIWYSVKDCCTNLCYKGSFADETVQWDIKRLEKSIG